MNKAKNIVVFILGALIGSVITKRYYEDFYKKLAQSEIESVKGRYSRKKKDENENKTYPITDPLNDDKVIGQANFTLEELIADAEEERAYRDMVNDCGYTDYADIGKKEPVTNQNDVTTVIPPEEFGENEDYTQISLTYYIDKILADENDDIVDDVEETVGFDSLNHFGEYENDSVHVRNDRLKCYYEILLDQRSYSEVLKTKPRRLEV